MINIAIIHLLLAGKSWEGEGGVQDTAENEQICFRSFSALMQISYGTHKRAKHIQQKSLHRNKFQAPCCVFRQTRQAPPTHPKSKLFNSSLHSYTFSPRPPFGFTRMAHKKLKDWDDVHHVKGQLNALSPMHAHYEQEARLRGEVSRFVSLNFTVHTKHAMAFC